jgi:ATP/ADP translocase
MQNVGLILLVFAFVFAVIAAVIMPAAGRYHFGWASIACWIASELLGGLGRVFH